MCHHEASRGTRIGLGFAAEAFDGTCSSAIRDAMADDEAEFAFADEFGDESAQESYSGDHSEFVQKGRADHHDHGA